MCGGEGDELQTGGAYAEAVLAYQLVVNIDRLSFISGALAFIASRHVSGLPMLLNRRVLLSGVGLSLAAPYLARAQVLPAPVGQIPPAVQGAAAERKPEFPIPEVPPLERMDYAQARMHFRTRLLVKGPSPETSSPLGKPPGAQRITYAGGPDGSLQLVAWVNDYEPSDQLRPGVLFLHGGNATGDGHWQLMKPYADAGFVVMLPSFRGENGQPGDYSGFYDETSDALAAARHLESLPGVDNNRLYLAGHSNGGTLALLASMAEPMFKASVPMSAGVDAWRYFGRFDEEIRFDPHNPQEFIMRSSVCFGHSLKCPTLLLRGKEERPFDRNHQLTIERGRAAGMRVDHRLLPGNHNGVVPGAVVESIRFFKEYGA